MAGFKFTLQTLLDLKSNLEKNAKNELGLAIKALEQEKEKLASIEAGILLLMENYRQACTGAIQPEKIKELKAYLEVQYRNKDRQVAQVKKAAEFVDKIREKLVGIMKERKVFEKLREKEFEKYKKELELVEQKLTDELVSYKETVKKDAANL